jgi:hypothetical protein
VGLRFDPYGRLWGKANKNKNKNKNKTNKHKESGEGVRIKKRRAENTVQQT